jgi:hypothetical protein
MRQLRGLLFCILACGINKAKASRDSIGETFLIIRPRLHFEQGALEVGLPVPLFACSRTAELQQHISPRLSSVPRDAPTAAAMSEMIQQAMEGMVPELEEYIRATLFTKVRPRLRSLSHSI